MLNMINKERRRSMNAILIQPSGKEPRRTPNEAGKGMVALTSFLGNCGLPDGKAHTISLALSNYLKECSVNVSKWVSLGGKRWCLGRYNLNLPHL
jgi:hypothetical protein